MARLGFKLSERAKAQHETITKTKESKIMKRKIQIIISASAASVLALAAVAQNLPNSETDRPTYSTDRVGQPRADRLNGAAKASDLIGMTVKNYQDEKLGKVDDLAVDMESGRIVQVILSTGGLFGMGDHLTAVPPGALHHDVGQNVLHLQADKQKLRSAPKFDNSKWDAGTQSTQVTEVYSYYDEQPYFRDNPERSAATAQDVKLVNSLPRHLDGTVNTDGPKTVEKLRNTAAVRNVAQTQNTRAVRQADGSWQREYYVNENATNNNGLQTQNSRSSARADGTLSREGSSPANENNRSGVQIPHTRSTRNADISWDQESEANENGNASSPAGLGYVQKASKLMGTAVNNRENEKLGTIENLLVDLSSGRIVAVIISTGGFLGLRDELSAVPASALRFSSDRDTLQLDASKESLSNAPHFQANQWPDFAQPGYAGGVYRAYQVEPYFTTDTTTDIDNTRQNIRAPDDRTALDNAARNIRDRSAETLTPLNQGNSQADVATTAQIRKAIIAGENMSLNARNVKIITQDGQVTLRGPVASAEEKRRIGEIAEQSTHSGTVNNQLEVKTNPE